MSFAHVDSRRITLLAFFSFTFILGLTTYTQYGISWDEPIQRELGLATWDYVFAKRDTLHSMINQYYDPAIEWLEVLPEKILNLQSERDIYYSRHAMNYFIFWIGTIFFFLLAKKILKNHWLALLAVLILYLTPRIYAHAFYNSKDMPLLSFFVICSYFLVSFIERPSFIYAIILALTCGILFGIRIAGLLVPGCAIGFFVLNIINGNLAVRQLKFLAVFILLFPLFLYAFYPVIWPDPVHNLSQAFKMMSHFPFEAKVFFMGKFLYPKELPWYYIPVWMGITIPLMWQILFVTGFLFIIIRILPKPSMWKKEWPILYVLAWLFIPWFLVLVLHAHVYDEWRHLFFIYPAFVLVALFGIRWLFTESNFQFKWKRLLQVMVAGLLMWQIIVTSLFMVRNHPYQFIYFSPLAPKNTGQKLELDYWGLSYRAAWEFLFKYDGADSLKVQWQNDPAEFNLLLFPPQERNRVVRTGGDFDYFLTNYRLYPQYPEFSEKIYSLKVDGLEMMTIFKGPPNREK